MSVYDNIVNGKYESHKEYPSYSYYKDLMDQGIDRMDEYNELVEKVKLKEEKDN